MDELTDALRAVERFSSSGGLRDRISELEYRLPKLARGDAIKYLKSEGISEHALLGALAIKAMAGQINVVVHVLGILASLPHVLEADEIIESLSLGAGNTGKRFDMETSKQVAEFKFIGWRGGAEAIRQNSVFADLFNLASADTEKRRVLYVVGKEHPLRFLRGGRALSSVLSKNASVAARFRNRHPDLLRVSEYYALVEHAVEIVDLRDAVPAFGQVSDAALDDDG